MNGVKEFEVLSSRYKNPYMAAQQIINEAKNKMADNNMLLASQALTWAITNTKPDAVISYSDTEYKTKFNSLLNSVLSEISDNRIKESVLHSFSESISKNYIENPVFIYDDTLTDYEKTRVRVICKMLLNKYSF